MYILPKLYIILSSYNFAFVFQAFTLEFVFSHTVGIDTNSYLAMQTMNTPRKLMSVTRVTDIKNGQWTVSLQIKTAINLN